MPRGTPLAPCKRCGESKGPGPKGRRYCAACKPLAEIEAKNDARLRANDWYWAHRDRKPCPRCGASNEGQRSLLCKTCLEDGARDDLAEASYQRWLTKIRKPCNRCGGPKAPGDRFTCSQCKEIADKERNANKKARVREYRRYRGESGIWRTIVLAEPCSYCGNRSVTVDHIVPISRGGETEWENLTGACSSCNGRKQNTSLLHFLTTTPTL